MAVSRRPQGQVEDDAEEREANGAMRKKLKSILQGSLGLHGSAVGATRGLRRGKDMDWRVMLAAMPDAAVVLDGSARVLEFNAPFSELYPDVRSNQPLSRWLRNPDLFQAIEDAAGGKPEVVILIHRLPVERRIAARVVRLGETSPDEVGRLAPFYLITFRDLTEQDKLAQMREDFIANASHELRTPLASLRGFIETLQGPAREDAGARDRFLALMAGQAERMTRLIDDLLSLSRVEMRAHVMPRAIIDLNEVAAYVLETLQPMAIAAGAHLHLELDKTPARFRGERDEIVQVISNLAHNAITYGGEGVEVNVSVSRVRAQGGHPERVRVAVSDNGPGIPKEHLPRLTERFYRPSVSASRSKGGTGLGLAIVKHIVARHRGDLEIQSQLGRGSTFAAFFDAVE
ncbi:MAG: ATP-binding protein [Hyphomicrobiaceae bacterium]